MKGISPMIATVLLIAFTVAVGGIVSLFLTGLTKTQTGLTEASSTNVTKCAGVSIDIVSVGGLPANQTIYSNPSSETITSISFAMSDGTIFTPGARTLTSGNISNVYLWRGSNTSVTAFGLCQGSVGVKGICKTGESCWPSS